MLTQLLTMTTTHKFPSLLVGQHQDGHAVALGQLGDLEQLQLGLLQAVGVPGVDDKDDAVGAARVGAPERPRLVLAANVPHQKVVALRAPVPASDLQ